MRLFANKLATASVIVLALFTTCVSNAIAFDGSRKGFQIGLGIGGHTSGFTFSENNAAPSVMAERRVATSVHIGYGFSNQITGFIGGKGGAIVINEAEATLTMVGFGGTFYLAETSPSLYVTGLFGTGSLKMKDEEEAQSSGSAWLAGIGYELTDRLHLELSYGKTEMTDKDDNTLLTDIESGFATIQYIWY